MTTQTAHQSCASSQGCGTLTVRPLNCATLFDVVYEDGRVCISILHPPGTDQFNTQETADVRWRPILGVDAILLSVMMML